MMKTATIGSISSGSLKASDLVEAYWNELEYLLGQQDRPEWRDDADKIRAIHGRLQDELWNEDGELTEDDEALDFAVDKLTECLEQFAPPYCYFGSHAGDGADFGYWPDMDSIDELPKFDEKPDDAQDQDFAVVNDHGNVTVYGADGACLIELV